MSLGWFSDLADAEAYFTDERGETWAWDALVEDSNLHQKQKMIRQAYNRIIHDPRWPSLPTFALATVAELIKLRIANAEMAYYLAEHLEAEDHRKGLQAQAVVEAGIVKEKYHDSMLMAVPVPPFVAALLEPWLVVGPSIALADLARNEEESAETKVSIY